MTTESQPERRATSITLTVAQLAWARNEAVKQRVPMTRIIENAIVAAGAPAAESEGPADAAGA
jgi:hypothetical protein